MAVAIVGILVGLALILFRASNPNMEHAFLNTVWPAPAIEIADLVMAVILTFFLLSNTSRCAWFVMGDLLFKIPPALYLAKGKELLIHFFTQKRFGQCTDRMQWIIHLLIMTGYSTVFLLVVVFLAGGIHVIGLSWTTSHVPARPRGDYAIWHPVRLLGYYATAAFFTPRPMPSSVA